LRRAPIDEEEFLACARYGLMLAEQNEDDAIRANLLKLVRAWLAVAKEIEIRSPFVSLRQVALNRFIVGAVRLATLSDASLASRRALSARFWRVWLLAPPCTRTSPWRLRWLALPS
jgi:hypothetical protein